MPNTNPRISADEIRIKLDSQGESQNREKRPASGSTMTSLQPAPDPTAPPVPGVVHPDGSEAFLLGFWESFPLQGGDVAILAVIPESLAVNLRAEAENQRITFADALKSLLTRASEYGWS